MCGIFAYTGKKQAFPLLMEGLGSLEYRGYDSAGVFVAGAGFVKSSGAVGNLRKKVGDAEYPGTSGISHLRWATHGEPVERNAHPHLSCNGEIAVVHNGIIENFRELKERLEKEGHVFVSDTDTEVVPHLIEQHMKSGLGFEDAFFATLRDIRGTYALLVSCVKDPGLILAARMGAPIVLGVGEGEYFVASDASPIVSHTKKVIYLRDGEAAMLRPDSRVIKTREGVVCNASVETIEWEAGHIQKGGYPHFMLKEIMEEPEVLQKTLQGRITGGAVVLEELEPYALRLKTIERIIVVACGTAFYAGQVGEYMLEEHIGIPVEVEVGSEFRYRDPIVNEKTLLLAVTQSGETADTLEAIREARRKGALTLAIVNTVGSTIAREVDAPIYNHAGPEIGVASTKAFVSQLGAFVALTLALRDIRGVEPDPAIVRELQEIPEKIRSILERRGEIENLARKYLTARDFLYLGRKYNYPIAFEGALKLKEISYIHAEGCGAGEMKHGPLAMIDEAFPTFVIAPRDSVYEKMISNIQEIKARKGKVIVVATEGDTEIGELADDVIFVPKTIEMLEPLLAVIPLQLFAYYFASLNEKNVDRPRNLAKSVTVE